MKKQMISIGGSVVLTPRCTYVGWVSIVDRIMQQFGLHQPIPEAFEDRKAWDRLHKLLWNKSKRKPWARRNIHSVRLV